MKKAYYQIEQEKRNRIEMAARKVFSESPYEAASLNQIVKEAGISKGGMFKYIDGKEMLYMHIIHQSLEKLSEHSCEIDYGDETDYIERIKLHIEWNYEYYFIYTEDYALLSMVFTDTSSSVFEQVMSIRQKYVELDRTLLLDDLDWSNYTMDKADIIYTVDVLLKGYQSEIDIYIKKNMNAKELKLKMMEDLSRMFHMLTVGIRR